MFARYRLLGRLFLLALALPELSGCGWEPLYADPQTGAANADLRAIKVAPIPERVGQMLERDLRDSLNPDHAETKQLYLLKVTLTSYLQDLGIQSQGLGTRGEVQIYCTYTLTEITSGKLLQTATFRAVDSFDIQANGYSTVVAQDDAKVRDVEQLRHEIVARLTMYMQSKPLASS